MESPLPTCSVIVPTRDRPAALAGCLGALAAQSYPKDRFEVIVVDDGGSAQVGPTVERFDGQLDLRQVRQSGAGPAAARNRGATLARGSLLAFTDDDGAPDPAWLATLARCHVEEPHLGLGGRTVATRPANRYAATSQHIIDLAYAHYNSDPALPRFFAANNLALPADGFRELGGFDRSLRISEDRDICDRWVERGWPLGFVAQAVVRHAYSATLRKFIRAHFDYGRGAFAYQRARRGRGLGLSGFDLSFYVGPVKHEVLLALGERDLAQLGLLTLWQAAYTAGFAWGAMKR